MTQLVDMGRPRVVLATENGALASDLRERLADLFGPTFALQIAPEDGRSILGLARSETPWLAFVPSTTRHLEAITVLRLLGPEAARRVVLLAPATSAGLRGAWLGLAQGALDFLLVRPDGRLQGDRATLAPRLAKLFARAMAPEAAPIDLTPFTRLADDIDSRAHVLWPATASLAPIASWLSAQTVLPPVVLRIAQGARFARVVREELDHSGPWPVRILADGDRLAAQRIHLYADPVELRVQLDGDRLIARLSVGESSIAPRDREGARLEALLQSAAPLSIHLEHEDEALSADVAPGRHRLVSIAAHRLVHADDRFDERAASRVA